MKIELYKILKVKDDDSHPGKKLVEFVLTDGVIKRKTILGNVPDDEKKSLGIISNRAEELFSIGKNWNDSETNIDNPNKKFIENFPEIETTLWEVNKIENFKEVKDILMKIVKAIYAIKDSISC